MESFWFAYPACHVENFVNCSFREGGGPCQTTRHEKSGLLGEIPVGLKKGKLKGLNPKKVFQRSEPAEDLQGFGEYWE